MGENEAVRLMREMTFLMKQLITQNSHKQVQIKNKLKNFKVMFVNIRGMKTKLESFIEIVHDQKPGMAGIVERKR